MHAGPVRRGIMTLMPTTEVAALFAVTTTEVNEWVKQGLLVKRWPYHGFHSDDVKQAIKDETIPKKEK
jgi:hypothetical protein